MRLPADPRPVTPRSPCPGVRAARWAARGATWLCAAVLSCQPAPEVPARRQAPPGARPTHDYAALTRAARQLTASQRYPEALALLWRCLAAPEADRWAARGECLSQGQRTVDLAHAYYVTRGRYLHDLQSFGEYPGGRDRHGNDKAFLKERARHLATEIRDQGTYDSLARLDGAALSARAAALLASQAKRLGALDLHQGMDPDRGPIRTYRFAQALVRLYPAHTRATGATGAGRSTGAAGATEATGTAEAAFRLLTEREELRLWRQGNRQYPWFGLERKRDLEGFLRRFPGGPFADRARLELAALCFDLWLLSRPAFQRTADYRGYLEVGGEPLDAARGEALRRQALALYQAALPRLALIRSTYRPGEDPADAIARAQRQATQLRLPAPPADAFPITLFPPG